MTNKEKHVVEEVKGRLIEVAGRTTQDLGLGRIVGQVLCCVYLAPAECSLDDISAELGLSKAAVSIATRQLEGLGLLQRAWKKGDKKNYYKTVDHFGKAIQHGILSMARRKTHAIGSELDNAEAILSQVSDNGDAEIKVLRKRMQRARKLRKRTEQILENPIVRLLGSR